MVVMSRSSRACRAGAAIQTRRSGPKHPLLVKPTAGLRQSALARQRLHPSPGAMRRPEECAASARSAGSQPVTIQPLALPGKQTAVRLAGCRSRRGSRRGWPAGRSVDRLAGRVDKAESVVHASRNAGSGRRRGARSALRARPLETRLARSPCRRGRARMARLRAADPPGLALPGPARGARFPSGSDPAASRKVVAAWQTPCSGLADALQQTPCTGRRLEADAWQTPCKSP